MTQNFINYNNRAGEYAHTFRQRGWQIVPTKLVGKACIKAATSNRQILTNRTDDATFSKWFGPEGTCRNDSHIGVFTGAVSDGLIVVDVDTANPDAMRWWKSASIRMGIDTDREFVTFTDDNHLRIFLKFSPFSRPPRGRIRSGVTIFGDGDFVAIPVRTLADVKREGGGQ